MEKAQTNNRLLLFPVVEIDKCVAERLREAREVRGYNISEFANFIGLSKQVVSQYEIGRTKPSVETLRKISINLELPLSYFTNSRPRHSKNNNIEDNTIFFRSLEGAAKKDRTRLRRRLQWGTDVFTTLSEYIDFPTVDLPTIDEIATKHHSSGLNPEHREGISNEDIEHIANELRIRWKLGRGPINNLIALLESKGFIIVKEPFLSRSTGNTLQTDALSSWIDGRPFIYLSQDKGSAVRSRFDAAHELGHLLLHSGVEITSKSILKDIESEANYFAGTFLLPRESFGSEAVLSTSLKHFEAIKPRWKVSIAAMIHRCNDMEVLSKNQNQYLWKQLSAKGWRTKEPLDDELEEEKPVLLSKAMTLLFQHGICTPSKIIDDLRLNPPDLVDICGLSSNPFNDRKEVLVELGFKSSCCENSKG